MAPETILQLKTVDKRFRIRHAGRWQWLQAVRHVDLEVHAGEVHGIVGESGSGKSTVARVAARLYKPDGGQIYWQNQEVTHLREKALRPMRRQIQMVFQDPYSSLNPRQKVSSALQEPLIVHHHGDKSARLAAVITMLEQVGLSRSALGKYPHQFSGGQRQRICIARALMLHPHMVVLDEAVSALDVSVQAQILALLERLRLEYELAYLFISHDLEVIRLVADRVSVMYAGSIVETGPVEAIYNQPRHPYTLCLLDARPGKGTDNSSNVRTANRRVATEDGCPFATRCDRTDDLCSRRPDWQGSAQHLYRCHHPLSVKAEPDT